MNEHYHHVPQPQSVSTENHKQCTDKEFVGINITHDEEYNYYMDQTRMIKEANLTGAKDERLPYPLKE